jgi:ferredoxin--NADP+ reductase
MLTPLMSTPIFGDCQLNVVKPKDPVVGRIVESASCLKGRSASFVRHVEVDVSGTPLEGSFQAGQSFGVIPPGLNEKGKRHPVRLYSISAPSRGEDGNGAVLSTTCKRLIDEYSEEDSDKHHLFVGVCSNYLCDLQVGDEVLVSGPAGKRFLLPQDPSLHDYVFVATGTGIAPFRGMVKELLEDPDGACSSEIHLVVGVPYGTDLMYDADFTALAEQHQNFHYHTVISRPEVGPRMYVDQYIVETADPFHRVLANDRSLLYICGIEGMQVGIYRLLETLGVAGDYLKLPDEPFSLAEADKAMIKRVKPADRCMVEVY